MISPNANRTSAKAAATAVLQGDVRALARAISAVENRAPESPEYADSLMRELFPHSGRALTVGVTGAPGAGKSTLVDCLAGDLRASGQTVGIVAVDPSSPFTGGAILGDRIRMLRHHADEGIFIRSMATRGTLGGLALAAADVVTLLDAAGKNTVLVETVGVGQDEVDIVRLADVTIVILVPGMGDDVQAIKAGIMEIADIFVINKADRPGAERVEREVKAMLSLTHRTHRDDGWQPPVLKTVATEGAGITELLGAVSTCVDHLRGRGLLARKKAAHCRQRLLDLLRERLLGRVLASTLPEAQLAALAERVAGRTVDPYSVVEEIIRRAGIR